MPGRVASGLRPDSPELEKTCTCVLWVSNNCQPAIQSGHVGGHKSALPSYFVVARNTKGVRSLLWFESTSHVYICTSVVSANDSRRNVVRPSWAAHSEICDFDDLPGTLQLPNAARTPAAVIRAGTGTPYQSAPYMVALPTIPTHMMSINAMDCFFLPLH